MKHTGCHCSCGGEFLSDQVTVEIGGYPMTREVGEDHCDRCGRTPAEDAETQMATTAPGTGR